jgi:hypothetical protein
MRHGSQRGLVLTFDNILVVGIGIEPIFFQCVKLVPLPSRRTDHDLLYNHPNRLQIIQASKIQIATCEAIIFIAIKSNMIFSSLIKVGTHDQIRTGYLRVENPMTLPLRPRGHNRHVHKGSLTPPSTHGID